MAANIFAGRGNAVVAIKSIAFADCGLDASNIILITMLHQPNKSWNPLSEFNSIDPAAFIRGEEYYIDAKADIDLIGVVSPPFRENIWTGKKIQFEGDSITAGFKASAEAKRWVNLLCTAKGATPINAGVSGMALTNGLAPHVPIWNPANVAPWDETKANLFISFGVNDIQGFITNVSTPAAFKSDFQAKLNYLVANKGWRKSEMVLVTPFLFWGLSNAHISNPEVFDGTPDRPRADAYAQAVRQLAAENKTILFDAYQHMWNYGENWGTLIDDSVHPNDIGMEWIANGAIALDYTPQ